MTELSVIIPARNEIYLQNTIDNVLANAQADTEIIVILDGYWPVVPIPDNPQVIVLHHTEARGQRQSINEAARIARGKYLMKLDAHCAVGPGFDRILIDDYQPGWTVIPRMYNLDVETWQPQDIDDFRTAVRRHKVHDYMYIGFNEKNELRTLYYEGSHDAENKRLHARPELIDETMSCMGCCWFISADQFWKQGGCDENHGSWGQQAVELSLKAWLSGNALMVNKRTWFAHWFRASDGGFPYPISGRDIASARAYSKDLWINDKWPGAVRKLSWLVEKFNPPGWEQWMKDQADRVDSDYVTEINDYLYRRLHRYNHEPYWRGIHCVKMPSDMILYHMAIWQSRPEVIVEIGTRWGGTALFLQDMLDILGEGGQVVTIDIRDLVKVKDPRLTYLHGDSTSPEIIEQVKQRTEGKRTMIILDGDHRRVKVKWELHYYAPLVGRGQYLVVEDCYVPKIGLFGPGQARDWFLTTRLGRQFTQTNLDREFLVGLCVGGFLKRK